MTRPDIAYATAKLAEHLLNPSQEHQMLAERLIKYLYTTRYLAIQFDGSDGPIESQLRIATDAAFADDPETRKSSQGSITCLFGGPISWKAGKQGTVTTSSTEAELLAFTHMAKEAIATKRLFQQLGLKLDQEVTIECDNQQTIRLITLDIPRIKTALKHIDVHNEWARQAYRSNSFKVKYTPTAQMIADGLTKPLPTQKFSSFVRQLGLTDVRPIIKALEDSE